MKLIKTKDQLFSIENISILLQYLYIHEDHKIIFNNGMTSLEIYMKEDFEIYAKNLKCPYLKPLYFTSTFTVPYMLSLIEILKETPPEQNYFTNRWDEIYKITTVNLGLNERKS